MSALGQKTDICSAKSDVRFSPNSDRKSRHVANGHVCFTPESGDVQCKMRCLLGPIADILVSGMSARGRRELSQVGLHALKPCADPCLQLCVYYWLFSGVDSKSMVQTTTPKPSKDSKTSTVPRYEVTANDDSTRLYISRIFSGCSDCIAPPRRH